MAVSHCALASDLSLQRASALEQIESGGLRLVKKADRADRQEYRNDDAHQQPTG